MTGSRTALLIIPASNTTVEPEMAALLPGYGRQLIARVQNPARTMTAADIPAYAEATVEAAALFVRDRPDVVIHGCTAAGFLAGPAGNRAIIGRLEALFGVPVVSTADAMIAALGHSGAKRIAVVTPYLAAVNEGLRAYLETGGIAVDVLESFECKTVAELCAVDDAGGFGEGVGDGGAGARRAVHCVFAVADAGGFGAVARAVGDSGVVFDFGDGVGCVAAGDARGGLSVDPDAGLTPGFAAPAGACDAHFHVFGAGGAVSVRRCGFAIQAALHAAGGLPGSGAAAGVFAVRVRAAERLWDGQFLHAGRDAEHGSGRRAGDRASG